ncbi:putative phytosulfokines 6 isoform X1 [Mangifera indica]|uniref:putative phytosulfokines 6 isoform X1 n=1 Tax=Mangifera indica TaxID=29780 RepID=UPI001CFACC56|nr:putative phytosulfokines 6 isoform X1 [Mangifera indica]
MKQNFYFSALIILLILVTFSSNTFARLILQKRGLEEVKVKEIATEVSSEQMEVSEAMHNLMGIEACENGDEECLKRRLISEAHLDYIYTQKLKP